MDHQAQEFLRLDMSPGKGSYLYEVRECACWVFSHWEELYRGIYYDEDDSRVHDHIEVPVSFSDPTKPSFELPVLRFQQ